MIHHSDQKHVSSNTTATEISHISKDRYIDLEREVLWLRQLRQKSEAQSAELLIEIKSLSEKLARLKAQNEVLNNCWLKEQENHTRAATEVRVWAGRAAFKDSEIGELRRQVEELLAHLNPGEVA